MQQFLPEFINFFKVAFKVDITDVNQRREAGKNSFLFFCLFYLPHYFSLAPADFHRTLIALLEDDEATALGIIGFRGSAKTTICGVAYMIWCVCYEKYHFPLLINDTVAQVKVNILNIRKEFEENELLRYDFPETVLKKESMFSETKLEFTHKDILILGRSRGQKVRGMRYRQFRPDLILCDDLEDLEWVRKKENRDKTERWFKGEVIPAQEELKCKMIVIGNLLHNDALMVRLKKQEVFKFIEFPLIGADGNVTWKAKYPTPEAVERQKKKVGITAWFREYLLKIVSEEDQVIKETDIHYYPNHLLTDLDDYGHPKIQILDAGVGNDLAIGKNETNDFTTFVSGLRIKVLNTELEIVGEKIFVKPNPICQRLGFDETIKKAQDVQDYMPSGTKFYVEGVSYQKSAIETMKSKGVPAFPMNPTTDKKARLETISVFIKDGTVMFPEKGCEKLLEQLLNFGTEEHDDLVDALVYLIMGMIKRRVFKLSERPDKI